MSYAANLLSISRMIILFGAVFVFEHTGWFIALYLLAGLTDILDGFIARRTNTQSKLGARLDSLADLLLFAVILFVLLRWMGANSKNFIPWIVAVVVIRCGDLVIAVWKYHEMVFLHTWANKLTGFLVFLCPLIFAVFHRADFLWPVCVVAVFAAVEEGLLHSTAKTPDVGGVSFSNNPRSSAYR